METFLYLKAAHIVFIVTWFAGLFYMPRLLVYMTEASGMPQTERNAVISQLLLMARRLWFGITWPSAIITFVLGTTLLINQPAFLQQSYMHIKLSLVFLLYGYHFSLQFIFRKIRDGVFRYTSQQLRVWNEVPTLLLVSIVFLIVLKQSFSAVWGVAGLVVLTILIMTGIKIYKHLRK